MEIVYNGITITYRESENDWFFELRGRERTAESLREAKAIIDKPVSERTKAKGFESIQAGKSEYYGQRYVPAIITGVVAKDRHCYYGEYVWVSIEGKRSKEQLRNFVIDSPENNAAIQMINDIYEQIEALRNRSNGLQGTLVKVTLPSE